MDSTGRRVAVVMASSRGLGRACAESLGRGGYVVVVCAREQTGVDGVVGDLRAAGIEASGVVTDVSSAESLDHLFAHVRAEFGQLGALVTNAGGPKPGSLFDLSDDDWSAAVQLTLMSSVRAIRLAVPLMQPAGWGRIILLGSSSVRTPIPGLLLSNVLRPAIAGLAKTLSVELAPNGITVNVVSPGRIDTERVRSLDDFAAAKEGSSAAAVRARSEATIPMGRYGKPAELAAMVGFLASDAASYVTGQSMLVDGGMSRSLP